MIGDGYNDLMALNEADIGISLSESNLLLGASFAVKDLSQVVDLILEGKNVERQIIDASKYVSICQFLMIGVAFIL